MKLRAVVGEIFGAHSLHRKAHIHDLRRVAVTGGEIHEPPLRQHEECFSVREDVALDVMARLVVLRGHFAQRRHIDLHIEVAGIGEDRAVLHHGKVTRGDHIVAARDGNENVAALGRLVHREDGEAVHVRFDRAHGVDLRDDDPRTETVRAHRHALAAPAVAADHDLLARDDEVRRAHDAVPDALAGAVAVIEKVLAVRVVDEHHRKTQFPGAVHRQQAQYTGRRLLAAADDLRDKLRILRVHPVDEIAAVVDNDVGRRFEHGVDRTLVLLRGRAVDGADVHPARGEGRGNVVLRGERVAARDVHFRAAHFHDAAEPRGFRFQMHRERHAQPGERLRLAEVLRDGCEHRHMSRHPADLLFALRRESDIGNMVFVHGCTPFMYYAFILSSHRASRNRKNRSRS